MKQSSPLIKGIIWDLSGVLFTNGSRIATKKLLEKGLSEEQINKIFRGVQAQNLRLGKLSSTQYWSWVKNDFPSISPITLRECWLEGYTLNQEVADLILTTRGTCQSVVFSGTTRERIAFLNKKYDFRKFFDIEVYSFDAKANKPSDNFFDFLEKNLTFNPENYVIIDDSQELLSKAEKKGFKTILFSTISETKTLLKNLNVRVNHCYERIKQNDNKYPLLTTDAPKIGKGIFWIPLKDLFFRGYRLRPGREIATYLDGSYKNITPSVKDITSMLKNDSIFQCDPIWVSQEIVNQETKFVVYEGRHRILGAVRAGRTLLLAKQIPQSHEKVVTQKESSYEAYYGKPIISLKEFVKYHSG